MGFQPPCDVLKPSTFTLQEVGIYNGICTWIHIHMYAQLYSRRYMHRTVQVDQKCWMQVWNFVLRLLNLKVGDELLTSANMPTPSTLSRTTCSHVSETTGLLQIAQDVHGILKFRLRVLVLIRLWRMCFHKMATSTYATNQSHVFWPFRTILTQNINVCRWLPNLSRTQPLQARKHEL